MVVGILGGGQLGRMLALAGYPLGLHFRILDPAADAGAGVLAEHLVASYNDAANLARFADGLDVATYEFENVPVAAVRMLAPRCPVFPSIEALAIAQDRLHEKNCFQEQGIPTTQYVPVNSYGELEHALTRIGFPAVLKTRRFGYDGKGQVIVHGEHDAAPAWESLDGQPLLLEQFVQFEREVSLLAVRSVSGETAVYPLVENTHHHGILARSLCPAPGDPAQLALLQAQAEDYGKRLLNRLNYVGVLAIEFFQVGDELLANEMAPRVHNSGHWTIEGAETSQFANHLRAVLDWPLGTTRLLGYSAMLNIIGGLPDLEDLLALPGVHLHLYDKAPRPWRKLGHVTVRADTAEERDALLAHPALRRWQAT